MESRRVRGVAVGATLVAAGWFAGCSATGSATVDAQVADARISRVESPGPPRDLQILLVDGTCIASWRPPADDGGAPVTGYVVTTETQTPTMVGAGPDIGSAATARRTPASPVAIAPTALPQTIRISARNVAGEGPAGDPAIC